jgi:hypothetical protein
MRGADHAGIDVGQQHRRAISGQDAECDAGRSVTIVDLRHPSVRRRASATRRVRLVDRDERAANGKPARRTRAVLAHEPDVVARAVAAIERGEHALRNAALPRRETVPQLRRRPGFRVRSLP